MPRGRESRNEPMGPFRDKAYDKSRIVGCALAIPPLLHEHAFDVAVVGVSSGHELNE